MPEVALLDALRTTGTCRRFSDAPVPRELLTEALDAARFAPQGGNLQPVRWVVVEDRATMATLGSWYVELFQRHAADRADDAATAFAHGFGRLPALVVVCAKLSALWATDEDLGRLSVVGGASIYPAVQSFCLACRAVGLGTALTTLLCLREADVRELLGIPANMATAAHVAVGHPARPWPARLRRRPLAEVAFAERYGRPLAHESARGKSRGHHGRDERHRSRSR